MRMWCLCEGDLWGTGVHLGLSLGWRERCFVAPYVGFFWMGICLVWELR